MEPEALVERARVLGVTLSVAGDRIRYSPKSGTPDEFVEMLKEHKAQLLAFLSGQIEREPQQRTQYLQDADDESCGLPGVWIEATEVTAINCSVCGSNQWWRRWDKKWVCGVCYPQFMVEKRGNQ